VKTATESSSGMGQYALFHYVRMEFVRNHPLPSHPRKFLKDVFGESQEWRKNIIAIMQLSLKAIVA